MSFIITCPICGPRDAYEFHYGDQDRGRMPDQEGLSREEFVEHALMRPAKAEPQREWWCHSVGCGTWFRITRDPLSGREVDHE